MASSRTRRRDRVLYGSNWPVCVQNTGATYEQVFRIVHGYVTARRAPADKFFAAKAKNAYKWLAR